MPTTQFAVTWDYRCPFAFNAHDHIVAALEAGADWDVTFVPFSLGQVHVAEGEVDIWDRPDDDTGLLALRAGTAVRDAFPDQFLVVHRELFRARHIHGHKLNEEQVVRDVLDAAGVDADAVFASITDGSALQTVRSSHETAVADHSVWGVPTFILGEHASFVRLMNRSDGDAEASRRTIERVLDLLDTFGDLNEFKHTSIPR
jgi:2-hydroxychromene-2-carboxylate isomerase